MSKVTKLNIFGFAQLLLVIFHLFECSTFIPEDLLSFFINIGKLLLLALIVFDFITKPINKKTLMISIFAILISILTTMVSRNDEILLITLIALAARDIDIDKLIIRDFIFRGLALIVLIICFINNATPEVWQAERISLGLYHPNVLGGVLMVLGIELLYITRNSKNLVSFVFGFALLYFNWSVCKSRTSLGVLAFAIICFVLLKLDINLIKNKVSQFITRNSYILFVALSFVLVYFFSKEAPFAIKLDSWFSGRMFLSQNYLNIYDINLFGNELLTFDEPYYAVDGTLFYVVDMAFIYNTLCFGIAGILFFGFLYNFSFRELYKKNNYYLITCILLLFIYGFMETGSFKYYDNPFLIVLSIGMFAKKENEEEFYLNKYFVSIISVILICLFVLRTQILNFNSQFLVAGNQNMYDQYKYMMAFKDTLCNFNFANYNWSLGLGASAYNLYSRGLFSVFNLLLIPLKQKWLANLVIYFNMLKLVTLNVGAILWLSKISQNRNHIIGVSLLLTFSSLLLGVIGTNYFDYLCLLPLVLYFVEKAINDEKYVGFVIATVLLMLASPSLSLQTIAFLIIYTTYRLLSTNKFSPTSLLKLIILIVLSVGITSFIAIPCILTTNDSLNDTFISVLMSLFTPVREFTNSSISIYSCLGCLLLIPYIFKLEKRESAVLGGTIIVSILFALLFQKTFGYFAIIYLGASVMIYLLDSADLLDIKPMLIGFVLIVAFLVINYFITMGNIKNLTGKHIALEVSLLVLILIVFFASKKEKTNIFVFSMVLEACLSIYCFVSLYPLSDVSQYIDTSLTDSIKENDKSFYRTINGEAGYKYLDRTEDSFKLSYNNTDMARNIAGISINEATFNEESKDYIDMINTPMDDSYVGYDKNYTSYYNLAGAKYWYIDDGNFVPPTYYEEVEGKGYYRNKYYLELGYVNNNLINDEFVKTLNSFDRERVLREYVATDISNNQDYQLSDNINFVTISYYGGVDYWFDQPISGKTITIVNGGIRIIDVELLNNDVLVKTQSFDQYNFCNTEVENNETINRVVVKYDDVDKTNNAISLYVTETESNVQEKLYNQHVDNSFKNIVFESDYIVGDISVSEDNSFVYTYVPYDKGWHITDNGNPVEIIKANYGFIGFRLNSGEHHVEFNYEVEGKLIGNILSIVSIVGVTICVVYFKQKKKLD